MDPLYIVLALLVQHSSSEVVYSMLLQVRNYIKLSDDLHVKSLVTFSLTNTCI